MPTNSLTSLAILKVNINQGRDYLNYLRPFVLQILADHRPSPVTDQIVSDLIRQQFGLEIPVPTVQMLLKRISKKRLLKKQRGVYQIAADLPDPHLSVKQEEASEHINSVLDGLLEYSKQISHPLSSRDSAELAIISFLSEFDITCLRAYLRGTAIPTVGDKEHKDIVLVSEYIRHIQQSKDRQFSSFLVIVQGHMLANALLCPDLNNAPKSYRGVTFYLDTPLLVHILGFDGKARQDAILELTRLLIKLGSKIATFSHSRDELQSVLRGVSGDMDSPHAKNEIILEARRSGRTRADLILMSEKVDETLAQYDVEIVSTPPAIAEYQIDETEFSSILEQKVSYRNPNAKTRDIQSVRCIYAIRANQVATSVEKTRAVLVTSNSAFAGAAWKYGTNHESTENVSSVITDFSLANMAWLKAPMGSLSIPVTQLLAFSYAALRPSESLLEKYMVEIDRLLSNDEISERDHQILRSSPEVYKELIHLTLGEDVSLHHETITEILERVSREIKKEELEKLEAERVSHESTRDALSSETLLKNQLIERLYWKCTRNARMIAGALALGTAILLFLGLYAGFVAGIPRPLSSIILLSELALVGWTILNLIFGVTVKRFCRWIESKCQTFLIRREAQILGIEMSQLGIECSTDAG